MAAQADPPRRAGRGYPPRPRLGTLLTAAVLVIPLLRYAVTVHAVPSEQPWRRACPRCETPLHPLAAASRPGGRCGGCGHRIGAAPYLLEIITAGALLLAGIAIAGGGTPGGPGSGSLAVIVLTAITLLGWVLLAVPLIFIDLAVHRLPDRFTLPAAGWVLGGLGLAALLGAAGTAWWRAVAAAAICGAGFGLLALLLGSRGYGLGDAKLSLSLAALLAWHGWSALLAGLFLAFLGSALVATVLLVTRRVGWRDPLPFGPFLVAGTLLTLAWLGLS